MIAITNGAAGVSSFLPLKSIDTIFFSGFGFSQVICKPGSLTHASRSHSLRSAPLWRGSASSWQNQSSAPGRWGSRPWSCPRVDRAGADPGAILDEQAAPPCSARRAPVSVRKWSRWATRRGLYLTLPSLLGRTAEHDQLLADVRVPPELLLPGQEVLRTLVSSPPANMPNTSLLPYSGRRSGEPLVAAAGAVPRQRRQRQKRKGCFMAESQWRTRWFTGRRPPGEAGVTTRRRKLCLVTRFELRIGRIGLANQRRDLNRMTHASAHRRQHRRSTPFGYYADERGPAAAFVRPLAWISWRGYRRTAECCGRRVPAGNPTPATRGSPGLTAEPASAGGGRYETLFVVRTHDRRLGLVEDQRSPIPLCRRAAHSASLRCAFTSVKVCQRARRQPSPTP